MSNTADEFELRTDADWLFAGTKKEIEQLWINGKTRWYPESLVARESDGDECRMYCSITDVICDDHKVMPLFCDDGTMRHIECDDGAVHVARAVFRGDVRPLDCFTHSGRKKNPENNS